MLSMPDECRGRWDQHFHFQEVRRNFLKAAQHGLSNEFAWFGQSKQASALILEDLLPMAEAGFHCYAIDLPGHGFATKGSGYEPSVPGLTDVL